MLFRSLLPSCSLSCYFTKPERGMSDLMLSRCVSSSHGLSLSLSPEMSLSTQSLSLSRLGHPFVLRLSLLAGTVAFGEVVEGGGGA